MISVLWERVKMFWMTSNWRSLCSLGNNKSTCIVIEDACFIFVIVHKAYVNKQLSGSTQWCVQMILPVGSIFNPPSLPPTQQWSLHSPLHQCGGRTLPHAQQWSLTFLTTHAYTKTKRKSSGEKYTHTSSHTHINIGTHITELQLRLFRNSVKFLPSWNIDTITGIRVNEKFLPLTLQRVSGQGFNSYTSFELVIVQVMRGCTISDGCRAGDWNRSNMLGRPLVAPLIKLN